MSLSAVAGLAVILISQAATFARIEPFYSWNTPIAWTGFILFADSVVWKARGKSWIRTSTREFILLAALSIPLWLIFEFYNLFIDNWYYVGLPEQPLLRYFGYAWSFSTIWPAIFEGADLVDVWRGRRRRSSAPARRPHLLLGPHPPWLRIAAVALGAVMLVWPLLMPSRYLAAPVWLGFIFLLAPINFWLGAETLLVNRRLDRMINLGLSGFVCGILWEFWNYWSAAKWHYTVPIMENLKLFEMPLPGYLGFPAFAFECFTMYVLVRAIIVRQWPTTGAHLQRSIALS